MSATPADTCERPTDDLPPGSPPPVFNVNDQVPNLNNWRLVKLIGKGGFGEVWSACNTLATNEPPRAFKFCIDPRTRQQLLLAHENNVIARVMKTSGAHPNIVPLLGCNLDGAIPWLMYEYVEDGTLADRVQEWRVLGPAARLPRVIKTLHSLASTVAFLHRLKPPVVHRDLKPLNVLFRGQAPLITDFGIAGVALPPHDPDDPPTATEYPARVPADLCSAGTRMYAPIRQLLGAPADPRDDVHALGVIAFQMIVGDTRRFVDPEKALKESSELMELRTLGTPANLIALIDSSTDQKRPERAPRDAGVWERTLRDLLKATPALAPSGSEIGSEPMPLAEPMTTTESYSRCKPPVIAEAPRGHRQSRFQAFLIAVAILLTAAVGYAVVRKTGPVTTEAETANVETAPSQPTVVSGGDKISGLVKPPEPIKGESKAPAPGALPKEPPGARLTAPPPHQPDAPRAGATPKPGEELRVEIAKGVWMTFCWVPAGKCQLGSPLGESSNKDEAEEKRGEFVTKGFWMAKYEVTQQQWEGLMHGTSFATASSFRVGGSAAAHLGGILDTSTFPADNVSWDQAQEGVRRSNAWIDAVKAFGRPGRIALPHEDEWEYACRGGLGNRRAYYFGGIWDESQGNCKTPAAPLNRTERVGSYEKKSPHPWGLCDMHGNLWEWCENKYEGTNQRVLRGGCWNNTPSRTRSASRVKSEAFAHNSGYGLRLCFRPE